MAVCAIGVQVRCLGSRFSISTQSAVPAGKGKQGPANTTGQGDFPSARQKENEINRRLRRNCRRYSCARLVHNFQRFSCVLSNSCGGRISFARCIDETRRVILFRLMCVPFVDYNFITQHLRNIGINYTLFIFSDFGLCRYL